MTFVKIIITNGTAEYPELSKNNEGKTGIYTIAGETLKIKVIPDRHNMSEEKLKDEIKKTVK